MRVQHLVLGNQAPLPLGQSGRAGLVRTHIDPGDATPIRGAVGERLDLLLEVTLLRLVGHVDTVAFGVELPPVVDAAEPAFFVAGIEQRRAAVGAILFDEAGLTAGIAPREQVFTEYSDTEGLAVGF